MAKRGVLAACLLLAASLLTAGCGGAASSVPQPGVETTTVLTIGTADSGGTMYPVGTVLAEALSASIKNLKVNVSASTGSVGNVLALAEGELDLALVSGDVAWAAVNGGDEDTPRTEGLRCVGAVYQSFSNWVAPRRLRAEYVHDLAGRVIGVGPEDSTTELSARIALQVLGLDSRSTAVNCSLNEGCEKMTAKEIDAMHSFSGLETRSVAEITRSMDCVILRYTDEELEDILTYNPYYYKTVIPAGTYEDQTGDIPTFGVKCLLCVDEGMDEALVYALTAALWDSRGELSAAEPALADLMADEFVCQNLPIPLHEGAERFYQEMGAL